MQTTISFKVFGETVEYSINDASTHETLYFGDACLVDASGHVGPYRTRAWEKMQPLKGAAKAAAERKIIRAYAESLLACELRMIPDLYKQINAA